jgi:hypothetical protein
MAPDKFWAYYQLRQGSPSQSRHSYPVRIEDASNLTKNLLNFLQGNIKERFIDVLRVPKSSRS